MTDPVPEQPFAEKFKWRLDPSDPESIYVEPIRNWWQPKYKLDLFGNGAVVINYQEDRYFPNRWIRFWSKVFFNSKWTLMDDNERNNQEVEM